MPIGLRLTSLSSRFSIGIWQSEIGNDLAVAEGFEPSRGRINSAVPYQLGYATKDLVAGAGVEPAGCGL